MAFPLDMHESYIRGALSTLKGKMTLWPNCPPILGDHFPPQNNCKSGEFVLSILIIFFILKLYSSRKQSGRDFASYSFWREWGCVAEQH